MVGVAIAATVLGQNPEENLVVWWPVSLLIPLISVRVEPFFRLSQSEDEQATGLYVLVGVYL